MKKSETARMFPHILDYSGPVSRVTILINPDKEVRVRADRVHVESAFGYLIASRDDQTIFMAASGWWKSFEVDMKEKAAVPESPENTQEHAPIDPNYFLQDRR